MTGVPVDAREAPRSAAIAAATARGASLAGWYALVVLMLVSLLAFVDRQVFILLAESIRIELGLSDLQLGLLQGVGVTLFAAVMGYPLGWLADRLDRRLVLAGCILIWSLAVVGCALARSFEELFIAGAIVGAGEAGLLPVVFGLIPELFSHDRRQLANSVYSVATRFGASIGLAVCGLLIHAAGKVGPLLPAAMQDLAEWRLTFLGAALPAPLMIALVLTISRLRRSPAPHSAEVPPVSETMHGHLKRHRRTMVGFFLGIALVGFGFGAVMNWIAVIATRQYGATPEQVGSGLGIASAIGTVLGFGISVFGLRWLRPRFGPGLPMKVMWGASLTGAATSAMLLLATTPMQIYVLQGLQLAFIMAAVMIYPTVLQDISPARLRSRMIALGAVLSMALQAAAPVIVGGLSDRLKAMPNGLLLAAVSVGTLALLLGAALFRWCESSYEATAACVAREEAETANRNVSVP